MENMNRCFTMLEIVIFKRGSNPWKTWEMSCLKVDLFSEPSPKHHKSWVICCLTEDWGQPQTQTPSWCTVKTAQVSARLWLVATINTDSWLVQTAQRRRQSTGYSNSTCTEVPRVWGILTTETCPGWRRTPWYLRWVLCSDWSVVSNAVFLLVMIPQRMRDITRTQLCRDEVRAFADCSKENGFSMVIRWVWSYDLL